MKGANALAWSNLPRQRVRGNGDRLLIGLHEPNLAVLIILKQFTVTGGVHFARPDYLGVVDVGGIVDPLVLGIIGGGVADDRDLITGQLQLSFHVGATLSEDVGAIPAEIPSGRGPFGKREVEARRRAAHRTAWSAALLQAKSEDGDLVCASVSGLFVSELLLARDGMRCVLVLIDYPAGKVLEGTLDLPKLPNPRAAIGLHFSVAAPRSRDRESASQTRFVL